MANNDHMTSVPRGKEWKNISYPKRELTLDQIVKMLEAKRKRDEKQRQN